MSESKTKLARLKRENNTLKRLVKNLEAKNENLQSSNDKLFAGRPRKKADSSED